MKKRATTERYVRLTHRMMQTQAWRSLDGVARAMLLLQDRGFIAAVTKGRFFDRLRHATEWRLTEFKCDLTGQPASRDFDLWHTADILPLRPQRGTDG